MKKTNPRLQETIESLKKRARTEQSNLWLRVAENLERPTRSRTIVNISRIERNSSEGDIIIVPGKVLGAGELTKNVTIIAWQYSDDAKKKISKVGKAIDFNAKEMPKGKIKIMG
ncbi:MAG: 50S ribosomal protein L18e [Candidatus Woesearchaeota archaeon]